MALSVGSLYVSLSARTSAFGKGMAAALKVVEKFAKETKRMAAEVAQMSGVMAAMGGAALAMASAVDGPTKTAMDGMKASTQLLAVQVADMLLPAVREMTSMFKLAAEVVAGLDPEVKKQISTFAVLAVQLAVGAKALSMFSGLAANVAGVLRAGFALGLTPILAVVSAIALVAVAVATLHYAFRTNLGGIADMWKKFVDWSAATGGDLFKYLGKAVIYFADKYLGMLRELTAGWSMFQESIGNTAAAAKFKAVSEEMEKMRQSVVAGGFEGLVADALNFGERAGTAFVEEFKRMAKELGLTDIFKKGTPIKLGRGMGAPAADAAPSMDTSSTGTMAWFGGMQAAAADGEGALAAISVSFSAGEIAANEAATSAIDQAKLAAEAKLAAQETARKLAGIGAILLSGFTKALGEVGNLINAAVQGAKDGGPWGALIAVIMEIVQKTAAAMKFVGVAMEFVKQLADMIEPLVAPIFDALTGLLGGIIEMIGPLFHALQPLFDGLAAFIENLGPVISSLGYLIDALAPIIEFIATLIGGILKALKPVLDLIAGVVKVIATVVLGIIIFLNEIAAALGDEAAKAESARLKGMVEKMWSPGVDELDKANREAATATLRNAAAQDEAAESAQKVSESLSNVPSGYRIANARYQADLGITAGSGYTPGAGAGGGGVTINGNVNVTSSSDTIGGVAADAKKEAARERGQRTGNPRVGRGRGNGADD